MLLEFEREFRHRFEGGFPRWPGFQFIAQRLEALGRPVNILETGTLRTVDDWKGNGQSTLVWAWIIKCLEGSLVSYDINPTACENARNLVPAATVINADSIYSLRFSPWATQADLLYLDSYDWSEATQHESALHHIGELAACWGRLRNGCLIAVDDCHSLEKGKHAMLAAFFKLLKKEPVHQGYITVWEK